MGESDFTIFDGEARYAGRTRVNRVVYDWSAAELLVEGIHATASFNLNGDIHMIILDVSQSKLAQNTNTETTHGSFSIANDDFNLLNGNPNFYCNVITSLDFTNKSNSGRVYKFQTNEGAAQGNMEHALSVSVGLSGHNTPAAPKVANTAGTATVIDKNQPWTGRVCGKVKFTIATQTEWAPDTGGIRMTILYS